MKNSQLFQYIFIGAFIFFIIIGLILFSTYRSSKNSQEDIQVTVWGTMSKPLFDDFVNKYFIQYGLKYRVTYIEKEILTFDQELVEALASGIGPDIILLPEDLIVRYSNKVYNIPFTVFPELNFKQAFIQGGDLYLNELGTLALPLSVDPLVMYWNQDTFNNFSIVKPPTTWAEIISLSSSMTKKDPTKNILNSTVSFGEFRNVNNAKAILSALIIQTGNPIIKRDIEKQKYVSVLSDPSDIDKVSPVLPLEFYTNFSNPTRPEYSWNRSLPNSLDSFTNGDLAIYFGFASEFMTIKNKNPNLRYSVALLPQVQGAKVYSTFGNLTSLAIMKNSKDVAGSYSVISALSSAEAAPFFVDTFNIPSARKEVLGTIASSSVKTIFNKSAIISRGWFDPDNIKTNGIFEEIVESYTTGRQTLDKALDTASERLDSLLDN